MNDAELVRELHEQHAQALYRYVLTLTGGDPNLAHDVVQETFLRAWRNPQELTRDFGSSRTWLYTLARHIVIDEWRVTGRRETVTALLPDQSVSGAADQIANREIVAAALRSLSREHRDVLRECYFRRSSVADAAERLGVAQGTIKSRAHYALRSLRLAIEELGGVP